MGGKKGIRRVKTEWWGAGVVRGADLQMVQLIVVVVTFFNHNFVNCKATCTLIWRLKIYEIKYNISLNDVHT